jgi:hypothetical protein
LSNVTTGFHNSAIGFKALFSDIKGFGNTATGFRALYNNDNDGTGTGNGNTAVGDQSLFSNIDGFENTSVGRASLVNNVNSKNTAIGANSMQSNANGLGNTAIGWNSLQANSGGNFNSVLGYLGGSSISGSNNTALGANTNVSAGLSFATAIGAGASVTTNNTLVLGSVAPAISVAIGATTAADKLQVVGDIRVGTSGTNGCIKNFSGAGIMGTCSSDMRLKQNIRPFLPILGKLIQLRPVSYDWRSEEHPEFHFGSERANGLIAQEVEKVFPDMVATDERGYKAVNYSELPLLLLQAVRELKSENDTLRQERANDQQQLLETLRQQQQMIQQLQSELDGFKARLQPGNNLAK